MNETKLFTRNGDYVATVLLPSFQIAAEVVIWGQRFFVWNATESEYREGMAWWCPPDTWVDPKAKKEPPR